MGGGCVCTLLSNLFLLLFESALRNFVTMCFHIEGGLLRECRNSSLICFKNAVRLVTAVTAVLLLARLEAYRRL
jgi:hypothetical protein